MNKIGLYVHVPFCNGKCPYCDFYSMAASETLKQEYVQAILTELEQADHTKQADTLYFGGGTPTLLYPEQLVQIVAQAKRFYQLEDSSEITLEANPNTVSLSQLTQLRKGGFNRISFGMQSAVPRELEALGRKHSPEQVKRAVKMAKQAGFENISVDLMLGVPYQTVSSIEQSFDFINQLNIQHVSAYLLKIEPGTRYFGAECLKFCPDEDQTADIYLKTVENLFNMGFEQYEISNFAKPGKQSRHNLKYWECGEYIGFGPAAHSFYQGIRYGHSRDIQSYLKLGIQEQEFSQPGGDWEDYIMLGMRLKKGIDLVQAKEKYPVESSQLAKKIEPFQKAGFIVQEDSRIHFTPTGFLVSNSILATLI